MSWSLLSARSVAAAPAATTLALRGRRLVQLRPVRPSDAAAEQAFFNGLSLDSRHKRFHAGIGAIGAGLLRQMVETDPEHHVALVAEVLVPEPGGLVADARYVREAARPEAAEFAIAVADAWQGLGLGRALLARLQDRARAQGLRELYGDVLPDNHRMRALLLSQGAEPVIHPDGPGLLRLSFDLRDEMAPGWRF